MRYGLRFGVNSNASGYVYSPFCQISIFSMCEVPLFELENKIIIVLNGAYFANALQIRLTTMSSTNIAAGT